MPLLSTVAEESSASRPSSPAHHRTPSAGAGLGAGGRSPLSRAEQPSQRGGHPPERLTSSAPIAAAIGGCGGGSGASRFTAGTYGSDALLYPDASSDDAATGYGSAAGGRPSSITGMLVARVGSLTGGMPPAAAAFMQAQTRAPPNRSASARWLDAHSGGGGGAASLHSPGAHAARALHSGDSNSGSVGSLARAFLPSRWSLEIPGGGPAAPAAGAAAAAAATAAAAAGRRVYSAGEVPLPPAAILGGRGVSAPLSGGAAAAAAVAGSPQGSYGGAPPSTPLEQWVASLGAQLASEAASRQRLQDALDAERRRAAGALQTAGLLRRQLHDAAAATAAAAASVPPHSPPPLPRPSGAGIAIAAAAGKASIKGAAAATSSRAGGGCGGSSSSGAANATASAVDARGSSAYGADGGGSLLDCPGSPFTLTAELQQHVAMPAAAVGGTGGGVASPSGLQREPTVSLGAAPALTALDAFPPAVVAPPTALCAAARSPITALRGSVVAGPPLALPRYGLRRLFDELGLLPYLPRFVDEAISLDMLLGMEPHQLERLGLRPLGYCIRVREAVLDLARGLLRACEEADLLTEAAAAEAEMAEAAEAKAADGTATAAEAAGEAQGGPVAAALGPETANPPTATDAAASPL
ncbi:hypothetical protein GPECTOR_33g624 [Gonium pectorale]|uniref:SAM domain-containing protein n=1 Tax=Gonium pectorale TaxID=33097 RepID=A0A150GD31_GONPE|nr:hypothetical protein GPECTOR_33g624 [Gonium pectorale]|eukprot:KXZ47742.1 hypothetical protein GPECTOR_33g624 [Gonium pectorale]